MSTGNTKNQGRPRDESVRIRILKAAVNILIRRGYRQATMNEIALQARVGKQTLYRWWANRAELLMEALLHFAEENVDMHRGSRKGSELKEFLCNVYSSINRHTGAILRSLIAESIASRKFARIFFNTFIAKRQRVLAEIIRRHSSIPEKEQDRTNALVDMIFGALWYRIIFEHRPLDKRLAADISELV